MHSPLWSRIDRYIAAQSNTPRRLQCAVPCHAGYSESDRLSRWRTTGRKEETG